MRFYDKLLGKELQHAEPLFLLDITAPLSHGGWADKSKAQTGDTRAGAVMFERFTNNHFRYRFLVAVNANFGAEGQRILHDIMKRKTVDYAVLSALAVKRVRPPAAVPADLDAGKCVVLLDKFQTADSLEEATRMLSAPCYIVRESDVSADKHQFLYSWSMFLAGLGSTEDVDYLAKQDVVTAMADAGYTLAAASEPNELFEWYGKFVRR